MHGYKSQVTHTQRGVWYILERVSDAQEVSAKQAMKHFQQAEKILRAWQTMSAVHFCSGLAKDFTQWQYRHKLRDHNTPSAPKRYWILAFHARLHMWAIKIFLNRFLQPKAAEWQIQSVCDFTQHNHLWGQPLSSQHTLRSAFVFTSNWSSAALKTLF